MCHAPLPAPAATAPTAPLPGAWAMSIRELDSWHDYYEHRERLGLAPLTNAERRHRAEIERNIHLRHEARRYGSFAR